MRSAFAVFLRGFTLPFGATTGRRLVFDGTNGIIEVYDTSNRLRVRIGAGSGSTIELLSGDPQEIRTAVLTALSHIVSGETYETLRLEGPANSNDGITDETANIELRSRSEDGSEAPMIALRAQANTQDLRLGILDDSSGTRNQPSGTAVLVAGTVTVAHTEVTASSRIAIWRQVAGGTLGHLSVGVITAGTSFVINSSDVADTSTVGYLIWEPL
jgi:hypothetical protein